MDEPRTIEHRTPTGSRPTVGEDDRDSGAQWTTVVADSLRLPTRPPKGKTGRRSRIYDTLAVHTVIAALESGNSMEGAAALAGLPTSAIYSWIRRGEDEETRREDERMTPTWRKEHGEPAWEEEQPYLLFQEAVARARAMFEVEAVAVIRQVMHGGILKKEVIRTYENSEGKQVTETEQEVSLPDGKLALEYLTRTRPKQWAKMPMNVKAEVTGPGGGPVQTSDVNLQGLAGRVREQLDRQARDRESLGVDEQGRPALEGEVA